MSESEEDSKAKEADHPNKGPVSDSSATIGDKFGDDFISDDGTTPQRSRSRLSSKHFQRNLLLGIFTILPIWATWLVFKLIFSQLSRIGEPTVIALSDWVSQYSPLLSKWLLDPLVHSSLAVLFTLTAVYFVGFFASLVVGKRLLMVFDSIIQRIPLAEKVYGATKQLIVSLQADPDRAKRVVLINFPSDGMKTIGLVTATFPDSETGVALAAVYVPTTPNPTSGYLEIVPVSELTPTDMGFDEAMTFVMSGGAVAPKGLSYFRKPQK
jgi:uncharacterized membrane protein